MREVEFRGKRLTDGEFTFGYLVAVGENAVITANSKQYYACDKETVGQFTGEKDKKGQKLFEGDVILSGYLGNKYLIKFVDGAFMGVSKNERGTCMALSNSVKLGNIHDNPELMEVLE